MVDRGIALVGMMEKRHVANKKVRSERSVASATIEREDLPVL
jgi:hypothetical protein